MPEGSSVEQALEWIERAHPALAQLRPHLAVAVDGHLATRDVSLRAGAELALLPPVSGG